MKKFLVFCGLIVFLMFSTTRHVEAISGKIFCTNNDGNPSSINRMDLDGSNIEPIVQYNGSPTGIALDLIGGKIYWGDITYRAIQRSNLDGSSVETVISSPQTTVNSIALDLINGKIYWTNTGANINTIQRANLDGSNIENLVINEDITSGIALDITNGKMYWTRVYYGIRRANLDGSNVETVVPELNPRGIALDATNGKIYWTEIQTDTIHKANLDGTNVETLVAGISDDSYAIALDLVNNKMYWVSTHRDTQRANLDGTNFETINTGVCINGIALAILNELNVNPIVGTITAPVEPVQVNTAVNTSVNFTDPNIFDSHTATWDWGDNNTSSGNSY